MKLRFNKRDITISKYRINIDGFKNEKLLIGKSFNKRTIFRIRELRSFILMLILPYDKLNQMFIDNKI